VDGEIKLLPECEVFTDRWRQVRGTAPVPTVADWLAAVPPNLEAATYRVQLLPFDSLLVAVGTEVAARRGVNASGQSLYRFEPSRREFTMSLLRMIVAQPCGYVFETEQLTSQARVLFAQDVILPLATGPNEPPQVVACSINNRGRSADEKLMSARFVRRGVWFDLGYGVPDAPALDRSTGGAPAL
jgi:hypothetical protein